MLTGITFEGTSFCGSLLSIFGSLTSRTPLLNYILSVEECGLKQQMRSGNDIFMPMYYSCLINYIV